ncbi:hypothetical protein GCM10011402_29650 [Paracoccus acridae]|uniref:Uncharacterized protein n=1 Tax=Paracoccus acridae TaxID=1795310 RepID=A0ABQ1VLR5_9RHOB|nr:hypothetical protein GCM10011402_29650 [Paracoccus acridae]
MYPGKVLGRATVQNLRLGKPSESAAGALRGGGDAFHGRQATATWRETARQFTVAAADLQGLAKRTRSDRRECCFVFGSLIGTGAMVPGILACAVKAGKMGKGVAMGQ